MKHQSVIAMFFVTAACACRMAHAQVRYNPGLPAAWSHSFTSSDQTAAKTTDYQRGLQALDAQRWEEAVQAFSRVADRNGSAADGALYWKAYAENRLGERADGARDDRHSESY